MLPLKSRLESVRLALDALVSLSERSRVTVSSTIQVAGKFTRALQWARLAELHNDRKREFKDCVVWPGRIDTLRRNALGCSEVHESPLWELLCNPDVLLWRFKYAANTLREHRGLVAGELGDVLRDLREEIWGLEQREMSDHVWGHFLLDECGKNTCCSAHLAQATDKFSLADGQLDAMCNAAYDVVAQAQRVEGQAAEDEGATVSQGDETVKVTFAHESFTLARGESKFRVPIDALPVFALLFRNVNEGCSEDIVGWSCLNSLLLSEQMIVGTAAPPIVRSALMSWNKAIEVKLRSPPDHEKWLRTRKSSGSKMGGTYLNGSIDWSLDRKAKAYLRELSPLLIDPQTMAAQTPSQKKKR